MPRRRKSDDLTPAELAALHAKTALNVVAPLVGETVALALATTPRPSGARRLIVAVELSPEMARELGTREHHEFSVEVPPPPKPLA